MVPLAAIGDLATSSGWESPLGIGAIILSAAIFFISLGVLFWGVSQLRKGS